MPVNIKGKSYSTVAERINKVASSVDSYSLTTEVVNIGDNHVVMKATLKIDDNLYTGHAYEEKSSNYINETSHLENCETSAIGRCLASANLHGSDEFCSADELTNALNNQNSAKTPKNAPKTPQVEQKAQSNTTTSLPSENEPKYDIKADVITWGKHKGTNWIDLEDSYLNWIAKNNERYSQKALDTIEAKKSRGGAQEAIKEVAKAFDAKPETFTDEIPF